MKKYNPTKIEKKWQEYWLNNKSFAADDNASTEKKYVLMEFPFPSGDGLHMGHVRGYTAGDVLARYYRLSGKNVLYPIGWDAFGLPAENYAIQHGQHPKVTTAKNIASIKKQFLRLGYSFDWDREINTTDPKYYKWTQWLFLQFYKAGLAYEAEGLINWCPKDLTGLANEEVVGGLCERCGSVVEQKNLRQWYLKITDYAEKLLDGLEHLPLWPERVKLEQQNWIGKSEGAEIFFELNFKKNPADNDRRGPNGEKAMLPVFTTRPDTIFGATFLVLSPEHPWVQLAIDENHDVLVNKDAVKTYVEQAKNKEDIERTAVGKEKTGVELQGVKAINPANGTEIPMFVADYVLANYGTGVVMAVPAHDDRDFAFAQKYNVPVRAVIATEAELPYSGDGLLIDSGDFSGKLASKSKSAMAERFGKPKTIYKLRDWVFSRQRYWGEPIPLIHCKVDGVVPVPEQDLPVLLPDVKEYKPTGTGESPLAGIDEWVNVTCPKCQGPAKRETNTMPQWAGSSWYYLRYLDAQNDSAFAGADKMQHWLPVDLYFGGMEHTTLHLLYSRFWNLFLHDQGLVPVSEPYTQRVPHGIILASDGTKMSKSRGNVVSPDDIVKEYGADALRMFELFLGPHDAMVSWNEQGISGVARFLDRVWHWVNTMKFVDQDSPEVLASLHATIIVVTQDLENFRFNTIVSSLMSLHNDIKDQQVTKETVCAFLCLMSPLTPHITAELHELIGCQQVSWPQGNPEYLVKSVAQVTVQINGKVRDVVEVPIGATQDEVMQLVNQSGKAQSWLAGQTPKKIIFVPDKLINFVL